MDQEMEKQRSRASHLLSSVNEFVGNRIARDKARYQQTVYKVASLMAGARSHRDLRAAAQEVHNYCTKAGCDVSALESMLNTVGYVLMNQHGWEFDETEAALNELIQKMVAMGRFAYGRI